MRCRIDKAGTDPQTGQTRAFSSEVDSGSREENASKTRFCSNTVQRWSIFPDCKFVAWGKPVAEKCPECGAPYLPHKDLDGYIALHRHGRATLGERGDYPGYGHPRRTLRYGDTWKRPGIRCTMRTTGLWCRNLDGHGFRLAKGAVLRF